MNNNAMGTVFAVGLGLLFLYIVSTSLKPATFAPETFGPLGSGS